MRRKRKQELYRKQEQIDAIINFTIGFIIFAIGGGILFFLFYFLGQYQGRCKVSDDNRMEGKVHNL